MKKILMVGLAAIALLLSSCSFGDTNWDIPEEKTFDYDLSNLATKEDVKNLQTQIENVRLELKGDVNEVLKTVLGLSAKVDNIDSKVDNISSIVDDHTKTLTSLLEEVSQIRVDLTSTKDLLLSKIDALQKDISLNKETLNKLESDYDNLINEVTTIGGDVEDIKNNINKLTTAIADIKTLIDEQNKAISDYSSSITNIENKMEDLSKQFTSLKNELTKDISNMFDNLSKKITQLELNDRDILQKLEDYKNQILKEISNLNTNETKHYNDLLNKVTNLSKAVDGINVMISNIDTKLDNQDKELKALIESSRDEILKEIANIKTSEAKTLDDLNIKIDVMNKNIETLKGSLLKNTTPNWFKGCIVDRSGNVKNFKYLDGNGIERGPESFAAGIQNDQISMKVIVNEDFNTVTLLGFNYYQPGILEVTMSFNANGIATFTANK